MCNENETKVCPICKGKGLVPVKSEAFCDNGHPKLCGVREFLEDCWACNGSGIVLSKEEICETCHGVGVINPTGYPIVSRKGKPHSKCPDCNGRGIK